MREANIPVVIITYYKEDPMVHLAKEGASEEEIVKELCETYEAFELDEPEYKFAKTLDELNDRSDYDFNLTIVPVNVKEA